MLGIRHSRAVLTATLLLFTLPGVVNTAAADGKKSAKPDDLEMLREMGVEVEIERVSRPILVQYAPVDSLRQRTDFRWRSTVRDQVSESRMETVAQARISQHGDRLKWHVDFIEFTSDGKRIVPRVPFISVDAHTDRRGHIQDLHMTLPAFQAAGGAAPAPGSPEYNKAVADLTRWLPQYIAEPVAGGDVLYRFSSGFALGSKLGLDLGEERDVEARVVGLARVGDRPVVAVIIDGTASGDGDGFVLGVRLSGFELIDVATGFPLEKRIDISGQLTLMGVVAEVEGTLEKYTEIRK